MGCDGHGNDIQGSLSATIGGRMLEKFTRRRRVLLIPSSWLNTVASWIDNLTSTSSTIKITRPEGDGGVPSIDVDVAQAAKSMRGRLSEDFVCKGDRRLLGEGLKWTSEGLTIDKEWLQRRVVVAMSATPQSAS